MEKSLNDIYMELIAQWAEEEREAETNHLFVVLKNKPTEEGVNILLEDVIETLEEGIEKYWKKGYTYRLDRRAEYHGGDQLHITSRNGDQWAYRHTGDRSEPTKYTLEPTKIVKDIVSDIFKISKDLIESINVLKDNDEFTIVEVTFN